MIDLGVGKFETINDPIYIGGYRIDEIWKGNIKIYPSHIPGNYYVAGQAVVINDEIHLLGGGYSSSDVFNETGKGHIKWDGTKWTYLYDLPVEVGTNRACVCNGRIYLVNSDFKDWNHLGNTYIYKGLNTFELESTHYNGEKAYDEEPHIWITNKIASYGGKIYGWRLNPILVVAYGSIAEYVNEDWYLPAQLGTGGFFDYNYFYIPANDLYVCYLGGHSYYIWNGTELSKIGDTPFSQHYEWNPPFAVNGNIVHLIMVTNSSASVGSGVIYHIIWNLDTNSCEEHRVQGVIDGINSGVLLAWYHNELHLFGTNVRVKVEVGYKNKHCGHWKYTPDPSKTYEARWTRLPDIIV